MPPEWMWPFSELTNDWFEEVRSRRGETTEDDDRTMVPMTRNEDPRLLALKGR